MKTIDTRDLLKRKNELEELRDAVTTAQETLDEAKAALAELDAAEHSTWSSMDDAQEAIDAAEKDLEAPMKIKLKKNEALILRCCRADSTSRNGFIWPDKGTVTAPDWKPTQECGNGLHGWLKGEGDHTVWNHNPNDLFIVAKIDTTQMVDLDRKVKFPTCEVVYKGDRLTATNLISSSHPDAVVLFGTATAGDRGTATAGYAGTATAGYAGTATAGDSGTATAGDSGTATAGYAGTATAGNRGTATAGDRGTIQIKEWDEKHSRYRVVIGYVGEDGIEPNIPYICKNGKLEKK